MPGAVRYLGMFRTAAVFFVSFGGFALWRYGFTDFQPALKPFGLGLGAIVLVVGIFLFRGSRVAIGLSTVGAGLVCLAATLALATAHGAVLLLFASLALVSGLYLAFALRALLGGSPVTARD
jgi:hypothetical protein